LDEYERRKRQKKDYYRGGELGPGQWFDDYGWWVVATSRAAEMPFFAEKKDEFRKIMNDYCWSRFTEHAPKVWERRTVNDFDECEPAVADGVWNSYWVGTDSRWVGPRGNPTDEVEPYQGVQNTVTNALYLIAAQRLGVTTAADNEFKFLNQWFKMPNPDRSNKKPVTLWHDLDPKESPKPPASAVVRERVSYYRNNKLDPRYDPDWIWTGDQGLILSALVDRAAKMGPSKERSDLLEDAKKLLWGAYHFLTENHNGGVLQHWRPRPPGSRHKDDYSTGTGVFWRNVLHVWKANIPELSLLNGEQYRGFIKANAEEATNPLVKKTIFNLTNNLSVLVAAIAMRVLG
jgi:hypothetical protein